MWVMNTVSRICPFYITYSWVVMLCFLGDGGRVCLGWLTQGRIVVGGYDGLLDSGSGSGMTVGAKSGAVWVVGGWSEGVFDFAQGW